MPQCFDSIHRQQHTQCCFAGELGMYAWLLCIQCSTRSEGNEGWSEVGMCVCVCFWWEEGFEHLPNWPQFDIFWGGVYRTHFPTYPPHKQRIALKGIHII